MTKHIPLADLTACHMQIRDELNAAWDKVMNGSKFIYGEEVSKFEEELGCFIGVKHVVGCGNGTDALIGAIKALQLPAGSEIIAPDFTFIAPVEAVAQAGYKCHLVDIDPNAFTMDPERVQQAIGPNTRAIIVVHLNGQCANVEAIRNLADDHNLYLIEDAAQGIGADFYFSDGSVKKAGSLGHISTTSFFPTKNLGGIGDGGAVFTDNEVLMKRVRTYFAHGKQGANYQDIGVNSRLDGIQAAVLRVKLSHLPAFTASRQENAKRYDKAFRYLELIQAPACVPYSNHTYHKYSILVKGGKREQLIDYLKSRNIACKVYYASPCHAEPPYQDQKFNKEHLNNASMVSKMILSIPMHSELSLNDQNLVIDAITEFNNSYSKQVQM